MTAERSLPILDQQVAPLRLDARTGAAPSGPEGWSQEAVSALLARVGDGTWRAWDRQMRRTGCCSRPVRLRGRQVDAGTGEVVFDTAGQPDGVLLVRCGTRRASLCPSCSHEYAGDLWQLLYAGLAGGRKGVPETVATHPMAFLTLTAPSFGPVHAAPERSGRTGRCRPRRQGTLCPHGRPTWCMAVHGPGDPALGQALCPDCYDYRAAVLFNWHAPELWRRFTIALRRGLARALGLTNAELDAAIRVSFAKVAEFQRRGAVHFHAIVRLDGPGADYGSPLIHVPEQTVASAIRSAAAGVVLSVPEGPGASVELAWGAQVDVRPIGPGAASPTPVAPEAVAAYVAKYATKATEDFGIGHRPVDADTARRGGATPHVVALIAAAEDLATTVPGLEALARWTHMLGFRGHFSTRSRCYSTTMGALRRARADYRRHQDPSSRPTGHSDELDEDPTLLVGAWEFAGTGYSTSGDAQLAAAAAARAREWRSRKGASQRMQDNHQGQRS